MWVDDLVRPYSGSNNGVSLFDFIFTGRARESKISRDAVAFLIIKGHLSDPNGVNGTEAEEIDDGFQVGLLM